MIKKIIIYIAGTLIIVVSIISAKLFYTQYDYSTNYYKVSAVFDKVSTLQNNGKVAFNGIEVGLVKNISLTKNKILVEMLIKKEVQIPIIAKFKCYNGDFKGERIIYIDSNIDSTTAPTDAYTYIKPGVVVDGEFEEGIYTRTIRAMRQIDSIFKILTKPKE